MSQRNPRKMQEIIDFTDRFYMQHHRSPSVREIAAGTTLQRSSVHNYLVAMNKSEMLEYNGQTIVTPNIREMQQNTRRISILGDVACGLPREGDILPDETIDLPLSMVGRGEVYILRATGDSMIGAGITDGDMVLVRPQETARDGDIVVAWVEGEGNTLKRLCHENGHVILRPENDDYHDIPADNCRIQGVALWGLTKFQ